MFISKVRSALQSFPLIRETLKPTKSTLYRKIWSGADISLKMTQRITSSFTSPIKTLSKVAGCIGLVMVIVPRSKEEQHATLMALAMEKMDRIPDLPSDLKKKVHASLEKQFHKDWSAYNTYSNSYYSVIDLENDGHLIVIITMKTAKALMDGQPEKNLMIAVYLEKSLNSSFTNPFRNS